MVEKAFTKKDLRLFSDRRHESRSWHASSFSTINPLLSALVNFCSFKHQEIDRCSAQTSPYALVIDLGAGTGAYAAWFTRKKTARIIAIDWSYEALKKSSQTTALCLCADAQFLPLKAFSVDAAYSIDTLGHVERAEKMLDEILRVCKYHAPIFLHSECSDYRQKWPDRALIEVNGNDIPAQKDGHFFLLSGRELYELLHRRFIINSFFSPAGIFGWLLGYPEKYTAAFVAAHIPWCAGLTAFFAFLKQMPSTRPFLRFVNACTNRVELYFGLQGGGSCFARIKKPGPSI